MYLIKNTNTNPYFNLAAEEYFLEHSEKEVLLLWRNDRTVVVGRNQNTMQEINSDYVKNQGIPVVRRLSGGGAVFHDMGNINYTMIQKDDAGLFSNYDFFTKPICLFLKSLGVDAYLSGRNDLLIEEKKFCGNAQARRNGKIMHHGCLLFSADVGELTACLKPNPLKIESKGVKSVRSHVTNILEHLKKPMNADEFFNQLFQYFKENVSEMKKHVLDEEEICSIKKLAEQKYASWDWNYGESPHYAVKKSCKFDFGIVEVFFSVENGMLNAIKIFGDFFGTKDISELEERCRGVRHKREEFQEALKSLSIEEYIWGMDTKQFLDLFF
ncbi:lipoate--protein ligase [Sinanaerobacter sp. ZZT-01]|uniref:lipoate--protein ligase n=1 Tax=Sinanaerobacter sp. ZZT-01 TaxID=3111540 RepID=UPI002D771060|nr:lipoate--protein ligase [Sinanaerobacter sp. ZZT-01]WRR94430.1 lipoate--protein ligase [Sinanaerobacter sp. ZZT-01]